LPRRRVLADYGRRRRRNLGGCVAHRLNKLMTHAVLFLLALMTGMLLPPLWGGVP